MSFNLEFLKKNKYSFLENMSEYAHHLDSLFDLIDETWENPPPKIARLTKEGYTLYEGPSLPNVLYVSGFSDKHINHVREFLIESNAKDNLENLWNSNIGVCNIRAYRFTHNPPREKTHYLDNLDKQTCFNPHLDGLLKGSLKLMIFKSRDSDFLTTDHGVIEIRPKGEWIPAIGKSPVAILFPPNIVLHRAQRPAPGKVRDCIELTIMRRKPNDFLVESSGAHAGYPKDLDAWNKIT